ncbi:MAG: hypothetical protein KA163_14715 [Bacteroidia bacterium]|nr:hypothetical protein [Bacteroidia bacterium]
MRLFGIFLLFLLFIGCNKEKLKAPEAFFIKPETVSLAVSNPSVQGTTSHKITDIWYYVNGQFKGAFPIDNTFPIPSTGPTQVTLFAGIKNNGISATRQPYEFYEPLYFDTSVTPGTQIKRNFTFKYKAGTVFRWLENFESPGTTIKYSSNSDTSFAILDKDVNPTADVFEGKKCFYFAVDDNKRIAQYESIFQYALPKSGASVYLEINYKCTGAFEVGVYSGTTYWYVSGVNASYTWNKIYIQLSSGVSSLSGNCGLYFRTVKTDNEPKTEYWIDNIKVVSY